MKRLFIASLLFSATLNAENHQEVFFGSGKSAEESRQDAYKSIAAQGKPIGSFVFSETRKTGTNSYSTVFKINTQ
jgi:hypothetical protein